MDENTQTPQQAQMPQAPNYSDVKLPGKNIFSTSFGKVSIGLIAVVLLGGLAGSVYLSQQRQDIQQHASTTMPACVTYNQQDKCASSPDASSKTGTTFVIDKCGTSTITYSCFDPDKGSYYTQKDFCTNGPYGPTDDSVKGHVFLLRKLTSGSTTTYSCVADCTRYPNTPHCPAPTATPTTAPSISPTGGSDQTSQIQGDLNTDGTVDVLDYTLLMNCYGDRFQTATCTVGSKADLDGDGKVDGIDYNLFLRALVGDTSQ